MAPKSIKGSKELARQIQRRRDELGLTIEEAAALAGVGTKTWSRYEAGESIREDKCKGICRALHWLSLPGVPNSTLKMEEYTRHEAWPSDIMDEYGVCAAVSFASGSDILLNDVEDDMEELSSMAKGAHIGQVDTSYLRSILPKQFLLRYDYDFLYTLRAAISRLRDIAKRGRRVVAHTVMEELALYLIMKLSLQYRETMSGNKEISDMGDENDWGDWVFEILEDMDLVTYLFSDGCYVENNHPYHFDHWMEQQFFGED